VRARLPSTGSPSWSIGQDTLDRQQAEGWGTKVIGRLAKDLGTEFPDIEGFCPRNLKYEGVAVWNLNREWMTDNPECMVRRFVASEK
jgi:hypothetical protein